MAVIEAGDVSDASRRPEGNRRTHMRRASVRLRSLVALPAPLKRDTLFGQKRNARALRSRVALQSSLASIMPRRRLPGRVYPTPAAAVFRSAARKAPAGRTP